MVVVLGKDDLRVAVVVHVGNHRILDDGPAHRRKLEVDLPRSAVVHAEVAFVVVDDLGGAIPVEVEDARRRDATRVVLRLAFPVVVETRARAGRHVAHRAVVTVQRQLLAFTAGVARRIRLGRRAALV